MFRADGRTDITKLIVAFCNFMKALKNKTQKKRSQQVTTATTKTTKLCKFSYNSPKSFHQNSTAHP
jgi:hypothetical protein